MVRLARKPHRHIGRSKLHAGSLPKRRMALVLGIGLVLVGTIVTLATFASSGRVDTLVTIGDEAGGFHNALIAINPDNGTKVGALVVPNLPNLNGCSPTQPKPYLYDVTVDTNRGIALAGLKPCQGGRLNTGQAIARFNVATMRFDRYLDGPTEGVVAIRSLDTGGFAALNTSGAEVWLYSAEGGVRHKVGLAGTATRFGVAFGSIVVAYSDGTIDRINGDSGVRERLGSAGVTLPRQAGIDGLRVLQVGDSVYTLSQANGQSSLVAMNNQGQVQSYGMGSTATSLDVNASGEAIMVATGCPTGTNCGDNPNRLYAFQVAAKQFQKTAQFEYLPLQTSPARVRFDSVGEKIYFDGVVTGSSGVGQRFVFSLELNSTQLLSARVAIPSSSWLSVGVDPSSINLGSQTPAVDVPADVPKGGGIGSGGIGSAPVPLDEIERLLGMSIGEIDWSKVTDEQIRAFGYDPAEVRTLVAQYKQNAEALKQGGGDPCANTYTQDAFVVNQGSDQAAAANGTVTQVTAQTKLDLFNGGWLVNLRWQAPGGAQKFHIYGRDEGNHKFERQLATVSGLERSVKFGGFNRIALPALHDAEYTLAVVPEQSDGKLGAPTAIKTRVRCYIVWCQATAVAK